MADIAVISSHYVPSTRSFVGTPPRETDERISVSAVAPVAPPQSRPVPPVLFVVVLGVLLALGSFTIDLYLPAFPLLREDFDVAAAVIPFTLTATTVGFGAGQLIVGPWSDRVGRRRPIVIATGLHIAASVGVALAPTIEVMFVFRFLQGFGAAAGGVVVMAIVRDLYGGRTLVRVLSRMALVTGLAPILAPIVGAQLLAIMPWRGLFVALGLYGAIALTAVMIVVPETLPPERRTARRRGATLANYRTLLSDRVFVAALLIGAFSASGAFAYVSSSSFLLQTTHGLTPQEFSAMFALNAGAMFLGVQIGSYLARTIGPQWSLSFSSGVLVLASLGVLLLPSVVPGVWGVVVPLALFLAAFGAGSPCVSVLALDPHPNEAGTAASLLGALNYVAVGLISPLPGLLLAGSAAALGAVILGTSTCVVLIVVFVLRPRTIGVLAD